MKHTIREHETRRTTPRAALRPWSPVLVCLALWLGAACAHAADTAVPEQAELLKLIRAHVEHAALAPDVRARTPRPSANVSAFGKEDAEKWRQALWAAWVEHVKETRHPKQVELGDPWTTGRGVATAEWWASAGVKENLFMRYFTRRFGKKPEGGWPLYINLHAGGNNREGNDRCWGLTRSQYNIGTGLYLCPRSLRDLAESWYDPVNYALLDRILAEAIALWDVNPDKVYLMGFSMGGWGVMHLAPTLPDRWAAVSASAGAGFVGATGRAAPDNLRNTPIIIQVGGNDKDFGRQPLSKAFVEALSGFHKRDPAGYEVVFKEHAGQGHQINDGDAPGWLARHTREPLPKRIVWQQPISPPGFSRADIQQSLTKDWPEALHYAGQVHWLRNPRPGPYQRIVANRDGNTVTIEEAEHMEEIVILLDDRMADLDKPVRVLCGGKDIATETPKRTVDAMIASLVARGDPRLMYSAEVTVKPPDTTVTALEGRELTAVEDLLRRARHRQAEGRLAEALDDLDAVVKLDPARGPDGCYKEMFALAGKLKDEPRAASVARRWLDDLEAVVRKEPARGKNGVFQQMLKLAGATKDKTLQTDIVRRWADADPANGPLQEQAARYFLDSPGPQRDPVAALRYAERVVAVRPNGPGAYQFLAFAQQANGKTNEAMASIRKAIALLPARGGEENKRKLEETLMLIERAGTNLLSDVMQTEEANPDSTGRSRAKSLFILN
jgi:pimeloyl-ACP methyl ester carboxylesterase